MERKRLYLFLILGFAVLALLTTSASAHYLWVNTPVNARIGDTIDFQIYWGHLGYDTDDLTTTNVKTYLYRPDGIIEEISVSDKNNYLLGSAEVLVGGDYQIYAIRPASVYQEALYQFSAKGLIDVVAEEEIEAWNRPVGLPLEIVPQTKTHHLHVGTDFTIKVLYQGKPLPYADVTIITEKGDSDDITTDHSGRATFTFSEESDYLIEVMHVFNSEGVHNGNAYNSVGHIHVLFLDVHSHNGHHH